MRAKDDRLTELTASFLTGATVSFLGAISEPATSDIPAQTNSLTLMMPVSAICLTRLAARQRTREVLFVCTYDAATNKSMVQSYDYKEGAVVSTEKRLSKPRMCCCWR